ncbi:hypothetical protein TNCV_2585911 [Trichonephila clavipes]|nr:hypothetical protein TNCV_2585911 [Trichonephila clavipes]
MIPPDKSVSDFAFQYDDILESGTSLTEATLKQRNASVLFKLIKKTGIDYTFQCLTKAARECYRSIAEWVLWIFSRTATAGSDVVQSGRPIFDDFFQHFWPYIGNNTSNVVFQMVKRLWLIRIDQ